MKLRDIRFLRKKEQPEQAEEAIAHAASSDDFKKIFKAAEISEGRVCALPPAESAAPPVPELVWIGLSIALILISVYVKSLSPTIVLIFRIVAALGAGFRIILDTVGSFRERRFTCDGFPILVAVILAFLNKMSLEGAIAITTAQAALILRGYVYRRARETMLSSVSLPAGSGELAKGDSFMLEPGVRVPADCVISQGSLSADLSFVTGERGEKAVKAGESLPAGCRVISGNAMAEVKRSAADSAAFKISEAIRAGHEVTSNTERLINRISDYLIPGLIVLAAVLLSVFSLIVKLSFSESLRRIITIISLASPCGILISIPLIYLSTMVKSRKLGAAFLSSGALESAARAKTVVIDKMGTLTSERFEVSEVTSDRMDPATFMKIAAHAVAFSKNPVALAVSATYSAPVNYALVTNAVETPGWGVAVKVEGIEILLGTVGFMSKHQISVSPVPDADCVLYMMIGGSPAGRIVLKNPVDSRAREALAKLAECGVDRITMVSGDGRERDSLIARELGISEYYSECSQEDKALRMKELRARVDAKSTVAYVAGRGGSTQAARNADLSIMVGSSDVGALDGEADVLMLGSSLEPLPEVLLAGKLAQRNMTALTLSGFAVKLIMVALGAAGIVPLWFAVLLDAILGLGLIVASPSLAGGKIGG